jgi:PAS domain S-box-containing protein
VAGTSRRSPGLKRKTEADVPPINPTLDLSQAVHQLAAPAYVVDRDGRLRWLNPSYIELLGDRRGQSYVDVVAPEHRQLARTNFARKIVGKASTIFDLRVLDRRGERVTVRVTSAPLRRADEVVGVFGIAIPLEEAAVGGASALSDLTPRQLEVLRLLSEGLETQEIAANLGIAEETARNHIRALLRAMGAHSRLEAVVIGLRSGLSGPNLAQAGQEDRRGAPDE